MWLKVDSEITINSPHAIHQPRSVRIAKKPALCLEYHKSRPRVQYGPLSWPITVIYSSLHGFVRNRNNDKLAVCLLAQLVEHCINNAKVMVSNPVQFFRPYFHYCLSSVRAKIAFIFTMSTLQWIIIFTPKAIYSVFSIEAANPRSLFLIFFFIKKKFVTTFMESFFELHAYCDRFLD